MRAPEVKICGITSEADALLAVGLGADAVGFVFAPSSRQVAPQAVRRIIADSPDARIIMCSAMGQQPLVAEAIQAGARDFVIKPFQASRVLDAAARALEA